jgi:hypothetical protein
MVHVRCAQQAHAQAILWTCSTALNCFHNPTTNINQHSHVHPAAAFAAVCPLYPLTMLRRHSTFDGCPTMVAPVRCFFSAGPAQHMQGAGRPAEQRPST